MSLIKDSLSRMTLEERIKYLHPCLEEEENEEKKEEEEEEERQVLTRPPFFY